MPNWCLNKLHVRVNDRTMSSSLTEEEKKEIVEDTIKSMEEKYFVERQDKDLGPRMYEMFDFNKVIPIPKTEAANDPIEINKLHEVTELWGTNRVGFYVDIKDDIIHFDTAWSPPVPIVERLAELYKEAEFYMTYHEPNMAFKGSVLAFWQDDENGGDIVVWHDEDDMDDEDYVAFGYHDPEDDDEETETAEAQNG